jgi:hypothetical protein
VEKAAAMGDDEIKRNPARQGATTAVVLGGLRLVAVMWVDFVVISRRLLDLVEDKKVNTRGRIIQHTTLTQ